MLRGRLARRTMKLIFLDVDGVICCNFQGRLQDEKLFQLGRVCKATDSKVVISSDWRRQTKLKERIEAAIRNLGVDCIGATPELSGMMDRSMIMRPKEITTWLDAWKVHTSVSAWVAIDDRDLLTETGGQALHGHFVHTQFGSGLTPDLADLAISLLNSTNTGVGISGLDEAAWPAPRGMTTPPTMRSLADLLEETRTPNLLSLLEATGQTCSLEATTPHPITARVRPTKAPSRTAPHHTAPHRTVLIDPFTARPIPLGANRQLWRRLSPSGAFPF